MSKDKNENTTTEDLSLQEILDQFWDTLSKKLIKNHPSLILPILNRTFHKNYSPDAKIEFLNTEYIFSKVDGLPQSIHSDLLFRVNDTDLYHLEFQRKYDGTISCRFLKYDMEIALEAGTS